ncbi:MAG: YqgE/AlgH family protein [Zhengella sp.]|uniref:YqgE/AlgH family protein n=1 Tax=Zhengella sp. TaxID=2282762 RepID=UPI003528B941|nr:YqgE/AlgH family protein [Brucellaceae bacterium]
MSGNWLDGQFLIAMPNMADTRFEKTVIYMCAHSADGAMGLVINKRQDMVFPDLLVQLGIIGEAETIRMPQAAREMIVRDGGPVERSRGFVLHTGDYAADSSMEIGIGLCLTATVDVLRAISRGYGPEQAIMALGYAGWAPGQLEQEISTNGWLTCPASPNLVFESDIDKLYDLALDSLGIDPAFLSMDAGHA